MRDYEINDCKSIRKINYSHMYNLHSYYEDIMNEYVYLKDFRLIYMKLEKIYKDIIEKYMMDLYNISSIEKDINNKYIYVSYENKNIEIMNMSEDFQSVFISLVLLYNLIFSNESDKYYLVEEPEKLLQFHNMRKYYSILKNICDENNVNLITLTNDNYIKHNTLNLYSVKNNNIDVKSDEYEYALIVEGSNEEETNGFITELNVLYPILDNFYIRASCRLINNFLKRRCLKDVKK